MIPPIFQPPPPRPPSYAARFVWALIVLGAALLLVGALVMLVGGLP